MNKEQFEIQEKQQAGMTTVESDGVMKPLGATVLDFFSVVTKWRRFIIWFVLLITFTTGVITFFLPKWYKATASVFPAEQADIFPGLEGVSSLVKSFSGSKKLSSLTGPSELDRYVAILKSGRVLDAVITKFDLIHVYETAASSYVNEKTGKELLDNTEVAVQDEGNLTISVYDKDPVRAADMANYYVELLNKTNSELQVQNARGNRLFVEQRYNKNLSDIRRAEDSLKTFQLKHGVLAMPEQIEASIKAGAEIYGKLAAKEIELDVLKKTFSEDNPGVHEKEVEVNAIRQKLKEMSTGSKTAPDEMKIFVPFRQTPELGTEYVRLYRDVEIQYKILQFITPLYEQSKVEEQRNTPSVVVLDIASKPERKAKPKIMLYALLAFVISTLFSLFVVFTAEGMSRLRAVDPTRFENIKATLRSDWFGLRIRNSLRKKQH